MNHKPSLNFIYLVVLIGIVTVMGLVWAVWQASRPPGRLPAVITPPSPTVSELIASSSFTPSPRPTLTLPPYDASMSPTAIPRSTHTPTSTIAPNSCVCCGWQWARQELPEVTAIAQAALIRIAELREAAVYAEAYGENCLNQDGTVRGFGAMTTDFYVTIPVSDLNDQEALIQSIFLLYTTLTALPDDDLPARPGYLELTFTFRTQTRRLRATFDTFWGAIDASKTGQELLDALGGLR